MPTLDLKSEVADWPVGRVAVAVVGPGGVLARYETGGGTTRFAWASVTKVLTALAVLDGCADGTVRLDQPAGPPGSTIAHLLAHASGLPEEAGPARYPPATRRLYSNYGYEVVAEALADAAGGPFADELVGRVLGPLRMTGTTVEGSPASSAVGSLDDLIALAAELLTPAVIGPEIVGWASTLAFPGLDGILPGFGRQTPNDWGLGCEIKDHKTRHWTSPDNSADTFGHFGQAGSFVWVDRSASLACVSLCDTNFGPWAAQLWPRLSTAVLGAYRR
ncbi:CubicO group peptidase, beta-lactamase class C family [Nakamurella panacisegetis]|uniref:CubicO group peptidase, beta-lactamase class C family n=1 Tax=Nakamurella panacisegetis TaxID=1090615 RepID=A0A1H0M698_9ACTN|nr:serine hydrolase domain-containing protein [Nakamurella panacisegetis]SDO75650.1 CubicO group peptidase, beta-lactamase class C family [Nakamurella panacisegetis]